MAPVRLRFGDGTVQAVPVFGSGGSSKEGVFVCFSTVFIREDGSGFGSWKTVPAVPAPRGKRFRRFRFPVPVRFLSRTEKAPKDNLHKEFRRDPGRGGQGGGLGAQILYVGVGFPSRIQCIKNFEGGGLRGSWGWGLRSNFGAPFLYVYLLFWGVILGHPEYLAGVYNARDLDLRLEMPTGSGSINRRSGAGQPLLRLESLSGGGGGHPYQLQVA